MQLRNVVGAGVIATCALACRSEPLVASVPGSPQADDASRGEAASAASLPDAPEAKVCARADEAVCRPDDSLLPVIDDAVAFADARVRATIDFVRTAHPADYATYFPATTIPDGQPQVGAWDLAPRGSPVISSRASDWRSGYFPGTLFALGRLTGAADLTSLGQEWSRAIEPLKSEPLDHDIGQRFFRSFGEGPDSPSARDVLREAAQTLDRRFDMNGVPASAIRALDDYPPGPYPVYVDSMVNVLLLFHAYAHANGPRQLYEHGLAHASTVLRDHVRANGSSYHIVQYGDGTNATVKDGAVVGKISDQGYAPESTWSRGQSWGIYGFTAVYGYVRDDAAALPMRFRDAAERMADYFLDHLPAVYAADTYNHRASDFVPPADFDAALGEPVGPYNDASRKPARATFTQRDSSAAAIVASALLELARLASSKERTDRYLTASANIIRSLLTFRDDAGRLVYLAKESPHRGILANAATAWNTAAVSLIYGDSHLLEAMRRYRALPACCAH